MSNEEFMESVKRNNPNLHKIWNENVRKPLLELLNNSDNYQKKDYEEYEDSVWSD